MKALLIYWDSLGFWICIFHCNHKNIDWLCKVVNATPPTLSICQCPPRCQRVESRARWMSAVTSCCSAAQRKVFQHRPTPGRSWTRYPSCRTTPCKVLQTSWPSEFPFAPPLLVNLTHIAWLSLSNNPTISATCHVPGPNYCPHWSCWRVMMDGCEFVNECACVRHV